MQKTIDILKKHKHDGPGEYNNHSPMGKMYKLFSLKEKEVEINSRNLSFVNSLNLNFHNDLKTIDGLDRFYFNIEFAVIEIMLTVDFMKGTILVEPFIFYDKKTIGNNFQRIVYREFRLYTLFKRWGLQ